MPFDVTGLSAYVANNSKAIALKAVANATTAKLFIENGAVQSGVKGSAAILKMDTDANFQDGSSCGRTAVGNTTLTSKTITVKPISDYQNVCPKSLHNTFFASMLAKGQAPEESFTPEFAAYLMDVRSKKIAAAVEVMLWNGDTALTGTTNNKHINGIMKQVGAGVALTATGSTLIAKLQAAYLGMPVEVRQAEDARIFIGEDKYAEYLVALANANIYKATDDMVLFGTTIKLQPTAGLNGKNKIYIGRISNFQLGLDGESDMDSAELRFSNETKQWYLDYNFSVGVAVVDETEVGVASI
ncbi:hypothetical protein GCM10023184_14780 [Flaviaesturariibacter amylovorans]|uniref:Phage major capsid protein n=2 Tax=Flaviaesturariibacter amylovorans TaxID=1084520 RepID=A0ABP8GLI7_9BACT